MLVYSLNLGQIRKTDHDSGDSFVIRQLVTNSTARRLDWMGLEVVLYVEGSATDGEPGYLIIFYRVLHIILPI